MRRLCRSTTVPGNRSIPTHEPVERERRTRFSFPAVFSLTHSGRVRRMPDDRRLGPSRGSRHRLAGVPHAHSSAFSGQPARWLARKGRVVRPSSLLDPPDWGWVFCLSPSIVSQSKTWPRDPLNRSSVTRCGFHAGRIRPHDRLARARRSPSRRRRSSSVEPPPARPRFSR
jgi:hypothetical protein